jgi:hypothetical protein
VQPHHEAAAPRPPAPASGGGHALPAPPSEFGTKV